MTFINFINFHIKYSPIKNKNKSHKEKNSLKMNF